MFGWDQDVHSAIVQLLILCDAELGMYIRMDATFDYLLHNLAVYFLL